MPVIRNLYRLPAIGIHRKGFRILRHYDWTKTQSWHIEGSWQARSKPQG